MPLKISELIANTKLNSQDVLHHTNTQIIFCRNIRAMSKFPVKLESSWTLKTGMRIWTVIRGYFYCNRQFSK